MPAEVQTHYRACNLCEAICGLEIKTQGEQVLSIKGDKNDLMASNSNNVLDKNNDDYYDHEMSDCPDLIDSVYFAPTSNTSYDPFEWACLKRDDWKLTNKKFKYEGNTCFLTDDHVSGPPKWLKNARKRELDEY